MLKFNVYFLLLLNYATIFVNRFVFVLSLFLFY